MSQPPAGGYPPPDQSQPGGYPPPAQPGPPAGGYPPPAYNPPPAPPAGGYPPPPAPGYAPPPAPGYGPPPGAPGAPGGYPPPAAGAYPPPAAPGYGPPAGAPGGYPPAAGGGTPQIDLSKVTVGNWIVLGLGVLLLIFSFFGWVSNSYASIGGWNNWWFLIVIIELAITVIYALLTLGILKPGPIKPVFLLYGAAAGFVLYIIALIQIFASYTTSTSGACAGLSGVSLSVCNASVSGSGLNTGPGFGIWASIVLSAAFAYFIALWAQKTDRLPFKVPGPVL